jgi:hypothetical protein
MFEILISLAIGLTTTLHQIHKGDIAHALLNPNGIPATTSVGWQFFWDQRFYDVVTCYMQVNGAYINYTPNCTNRRTYETFVPMNGMQIRTLKAGKNLIPAWNGPAIPNLMPNVPNLGPCMPMHEMAPLCFGTDILFNQATVPLMFAYNMTRKKLYLPYRFPYLKARKQLIASGKWWDTIIPGETYVLFSLPTALDMTGSR